MSYTKKPWPEVPKDWAHGIHVRVLWMQVTVSMQEAELLPSIGSKGVFSGADFQCGFMFFLASSASLASTEESMSFLIF